MTCPTCPAQPLALFICADGVYRCYQCKRTGRRKLAEPNEPAAPAPPTVVQTEHTTILQAKVHLRNRLTRLQSLKDWDKSPWNCGKHEGLSEALEILERGTA